ncbi:MAG: metallophosphoesterase [Acidimicrobiia bacterium]|nr:metallophosphoesterase [Acidimicrobiia bacterium]
MSTIRVVQLSDTHFSTSGRIPYGGAGYDPAETFEAVITTLASRPSPHLTVVSGDLADHGEASEYGVVVRQLSRLDGDVYLLPGNHDRRAPFDALLTVGRLRYQRTLNVGGWLFVFVDSNGAGPRDTAETDKGILADSELEWLRGVLSATEQPHAFVWVHHPPGEVAGFSRADYVAQFEALLEDLPRVRGVGCGHAHTDLVTAAGAVPVFICPSLTTSIDFIANTTMPPGFREYDFHPDGTIDTEAVLVDDDRWNDRRPLPADVISYLMDEIDSTELKRRLGLDG